MLPIEAMEFDQRFLDGLDPPWRDLLSNMLKEDFCEKNEGTPCFSAWGVIKEIHGCSVRIQVASLCQEDGLRLSSPKWEIWLGLSKENTNLAKEQWIGFKDFKRIASMDTFQETKDSCLWLIPRHTASKPECVVAHLFSGAFCGWDRALKWELGDSHHKSFVLDSDRTALDVWSLQTGCPVFSKIDVGFQTSAPHFGVHASISDKMWLNCCCFSQDFIFTISPPCQSWSAGGRGLGVQCDNGWAFIEAARATWTVRPTALLAECSEKITSHPHFKLIKALLKRAGYTLHWTQHFDTEAMCDMKRLRWLALWIRNDIRQDELSARFRISDVQKLEWSDPKLDFFIPSQFDHQLLLSQQLLSVYGDFTFLPASFRAKCVDPSSKQAVLDARCVEKGKSLPTLCASYSSQHELDLQFLKQRGIYGSLINRMGQYMFLSPCIFINLFGATGEVPVVFPNKLKITFRLIGNAITVQHALLALRVMFTSLGFDKQPISQKVLHCWDHRLFPDDIVTIRNSDFTFFVAIEHANRIIRMHTLPRTQGKEIQLHCPGLESSVSFDHDLTVQNFIQAIGIESPDQQMVAVRINGSQIDPAGHIGTLCNQRICVEKRNKLVFECSFHNSGVEIPQTLVEVESSEPSDDELDDITLLHALAQIEQEEPTQNESFQAVTVCALNTDKTWTVFWPSDISESQIALRLGFLLCLPDEKGVVPWFQTNYQVSGFEQKTVIADPRGECATDFCAVIIDDRIFSKKTTTKVPKEGLCLFQVCKSRNHDPRAVVFTINGSKVSMFVHTCLSSGDIIGIQETQGTIEEYPNQAKKPRVENTKAQQRIELMHQHGNMLASDEMQFTIDMMRICAKDKNFSDVVFADLNDFDLVSYEKLFAFCQKVFQHKMNGSVPILAKQHWALVDLQWDSTRNLMSINLTNMPTELSNNVAKVIAKVALYCNHNFRFDHRTMQAQDGLCGWAIIHKWFSEIRAMNPKSIYDLDSLFPKAAADMLQQEFNDQQIAMLREVFQKFGMRGNKSNNTLIMANSIGSIAEWVRSAFIQSPQLAMSKDDIKFGATGVKDAPMTEAKSGDDPWLRSDPWSGVQRKQLRQCRWEDLVLPDDHPICAGDDRLKNIHRLQMNMNTTGVSFCTRSQVHKVMQAKPKQPFALLLPYHEKLNFDDLNLKVSKPVELIVKDSATNAIYKRQACVVCSDTTIACKLPKAQYSATVTVMKEIVLEVQKSTINKDTFSAFLEKPYDMFRLKAKEQYTHAIADNLQLYGFRKLFDRDDRKSVVGFQILTKASEEHRVALLTRSGAGDLFARDFVDNSTIATDVSILPRFWGHDRSAREQAFKTGASCSGFAGLVSLRRGIAIRGWASKIKDIRKAVLAEDPRFTDVNCEVLPVVFMESKGWPISLGPADVIAAVQHQCNLPTIPGRCFRSQGVVTWTLGFARRPSITHFTAEFNNQTYEILLTDPAPSTSMPIKSKKTFKRRGQGHSDSQ